jgi:hypothetical protein
MPYLSQRSQRHKDFFISVERKQARGKIVPEGPDHEGAASRRHLVLSLSVAKKDFQIFKKLTDTFFHIKNKFNIFKKENKKDEVFYK